MKPRRQAKKTNESHRAPRAACLNCGASISLERPVRLFCSYLCKDTAQAIRYTRSCIADGRIMQPDVFDAIRIKLAWLVSGGYPTEARRVPSARRLLVVERDGGRCRICSEPGTDVDHILGDSNSLENLQLLCRSCHNKKTMTNLVPVEPGSQAELESKRLMRRILGIKPQRACDDERRWAKTWPKLMAKRRYLFKPQKRPTLADKIAEMIDDGCDDEASLNTLADLVQRYGSSIRNKKDRKRRPSGQ